MKKHLLQREQFCALLFCFVGFLTFYGCSCRAGEAAQPSTFCNPLNLPYRFSLESPSRREAADPTILRWNSEYWLFASKSGGYWHSSDFVHWALVVPSGLPIENYAPDAEVINGRMYFTAVGTGMFTTSDPAQGQWTSVGSLQGNQDPALFVDSDGKVYFYYGSSATDPIKGVELDASSFAQIGSPQSLIIGDPLKHGWELKDPNATDAEIASGVGAPFIEGSWMTKRNGTYYLQYAAPGTELKWYADGVYTSNSPLGPFTYAPYSPFSLKTTGFIGGTGHGSTFQDSQGRYWHADTALIGVRHPFERRLVVFPSGFVPTGSGPDQLVAQTYLGDYPQYLPGRGRNPLRNNSPGWMLLSYKKAAAASSTLNGHPVENAFDEDIRTWWSAVSGNAGEWLSVDLGKRCQIRAIQINFADEGSTTLGFSNGAYRYVVEMSNDNQTWTNLFSRQSGPDAPHDYAELDHPVKARYVRLTNILTPNGAKFSVSGLRIFGDGLGQQPAQVGSVVANVRRPAKRAALVSWNPVPNADFYVVRYGVDPDRLYSNVQVYGQNIYDITGLNVDSSYYFAVDAVNDSGVTVGTQVVQAGAIDPLPRAGWVASASMSSVQDPPVNAIDGNPNTRWSTGASQASGQWFQVDMGSPKTFSELVLDNAGSPGDYPRGYQVTISSDGVNWSNPVASGSGTSAVTTITFPPQTARFIRVTQTTNGLTTLFWSIHEFNVYGQ